MKEPDTTDKQFASAVAIKAEINRRLILMGRKRDPCSRCRVLLPVEATPREQQIYGTNWRVHDFNTPVPGCAKVVLAAIVSVMREYECSDW